MSTKEGQKVVAKIKNWPEDADSPFGEIINVLGMPGDHQVEIHAILAEYGNPSTATIYRLMEYGKELMASQAIEQIHNYFVKKQNLS